MSILKVDITIVSLFFVIYYAWYLKLKFVSNTLWTKIPKSNHYDYLQVLCFTTNWKILSQRQRQDYWFMQMFQS